MLAYILGITKWGNKSIANRGKVLGTTNWVERDYK